VGEGAHEDAVEPHARQPRDQERGVALELAVGIECGMEKGALRRIQISVEESGPPQLYAPPSRGLSGESPEGVRGRLPQLRRYLSPTA
jgi:hypothetical protein